jgi:predicted secreted Zn-dependent protease
MLPSTIRVAGAFLALFGITACSAMPPEDSQGPAPASTPTVESSQQDFASATRQYRQHAAELREMARRRMIEADVLAQKDNPDMEKVQAKRDLAKDLLEAADQSEAKARELQKKVPHGMVQ